MTDLQDSYNLKTIRFSFKAESDVFFNHFPGFTIRSMLGKSLISVVCHSPGIKCENCRSSEECAYSVVFKGGTIPGSRTPYILTGIPCIRQLAEGEIFEFGITLLGNAIEYEQDFINAVIDFERTGIGYNQPEKNRNSRPGRVALEDRQNLFFENGIDALSPDTISRLYSHKTYADLSEILIIPRTPLRIAESGPKNVMLSEADFKPLHLIENIIARINALCEFNGFGQAIKESEREKAISIARKLRIKWGAKVIKNNDNYFSAGRPKKVKLCGGITHEFRIKGGISEVIPLLMLGKLIHVGTTAAYGFGQYDYKVIFPQFDTVTAKNCI